MSEGWIKLHRKLVDNPLWTSEKFTKAQAWIDIIMDANHSPGHFFVRGVRINTGRGQTGRSELTLSKKWKWSRDKVRRFLKWLVSERMITLKQDNKTTIITVCNYEQYQAKKNDTDTPNDTASNTPNDTPNDTQTRITKNKKKKDIHSPEFEKCWEIYPKRNGARVGKKTASGRFERLTLEDKRKCYIGIKNYSAYCDNSDEFPKDFSAFLNQSVFNDFQEKIVNEKKETDYFKNL